MAKTTMRFKVTKKPPWYLESEHRDVFTCESTQGLFAAVANLMICKQEELFDMEKRYKPKTVYKAMRDEVIRDAEAIQQKPSRSLLLALMDLVDIQGGNDFESVVRTDRAGVKHILLAYSNYTAFYVPNKELTSTGEKIIPVVTQYSQNQNMSYHDSYRSRIGTYAVPMPTDGRTKSYFIQEVLSVPGHKSLELLKEVTGDTFRFWDMCLEVPTHPDALTPCFQQIQPFQLLRSEQASISDDVLLTHMEEISPMCCVLDTASQEMLSRKRRRNVDCFRQGEVISDLSHFSYENKKSEHAVYFRRKARRLEGKRLNLAAVVILRKDQSGDGVLYVSTTVRFCRAVQQYFVKGNGELVSCWHDTVRELGERETFIAGSEMYQEIHCPALTAFIKRVNPTSWCNFIPKHVECVIADPVRVEVVELAIKLMECKIPNAFAVAELLHCPIEKVNKYVAFWERHSYDKTVQREAGKKRLGVAEEEMRSDWIALRKVVTAYARKRFDKGQIATKCNELFQKHTMHNAAKVQKEWVSLIKHDSKKIKDNDLLQMYSYAKVLFLKLRTYHNKLNKGLKLGEAQCRDPPPLRSPLSQHDTDDSPTSPRSETTAEDRSKHERVGVSERSVTFVTPDPVPIYTWIKNMSTLMLSEPWLSNSDVRRDAVCSLLNLDKTLLDKKNHEILHEWVESNSTVVKILRSYNLRDKLSQALVDCLDSMSTNNWKHKVLSSFQYISSHPNWRPDHYPVQRSERYDTKAQKRTKTVKRDQPAPKLNHCQAYSKNTKYYNEAHSSYHDLCFEEANEACDEEEYYSENDLDYKQQGEDLELTARQDNMYSSDEYDSTDSFIDNGPIEECNSSEEEEEEEEISHRQGKGKNKRGRKETKRLKKFVLVSSESEGEEEAGTGENTSSINKKEKCSRNTNVTKKEKKNSKPRKGADSSRKSKRDQEQRVALSNHSVLTSESDSDCERQRKPSETVSSDKKTSPTPPKGVDGHKRKARGQEQRIAPSNPPSFLTSKSDSDCESSINLCKNATQGKSSVKRAAVHKRKREQEQCITPRKRTACDSESDVDERKGILSTKATELGSGIRKTSPACTSVGGFDQAAVWQHHVDKSNWATEACVTPRPSVTYSQVSDIQSHGAEISDKEDYCM